MAGVEVSEACIHYIRQDRESVDVRQACHGNLGSSHLADLKGHDVIVLAILQRSEAGVLTQATFGLYSDVYKSIKQDVCNECLYAQELQCESIEPFEAAAPHASFKGDKGFSFHCAKSINSP